MTVDEKVSYEKIQNFVTAVMNLNNPESPNPLTKKTHTEYFLFYQNHKTFIKPLTENLPKHSFKPTLDPESEKLAALVKEKRKKTYGDSKIENLLVHEYQKTNEKIEAKRKIKESYFPEDCTFKPKIKRGPVYSEEDFKDNFSLASDYRKLAFESSWTRTELLYNFFKIESEKKEKNSRTVEDADFERNMNECTFVPTLDKPKFQSCQVFETKGVAEVVNRMKKAREDNENSEKNKAKELPLMKFGIEFKHRNHGFEKNAKK